ncbi:unnamed protein product [Adineta ricciae]|uniref:NAD(P)(+)--arginine ADP-ribosyltransferase n=1 Tax=Adineta ricciae TaxID=249248 RepID=A0A813ZQ62_ADIRI|nr:unnamed protein product [Adineta ricciae]CAF1366631.1 unnamed protein product [Adineta ricciae]
MDSTAHSSHEHIRETNYIHTSNPAKYENIEDINVIWLDSRLNVSLDCLDTERRLRRMIDRLLTFNSCDAFLKYIDTETQERIFFIVSGSDGEFIVPRIHSLSKISSIYIFCGDIVKHEQWSKDFTKIHGIFNTKDALFKRVTSDMTLYLTNLLSFSILGKQDIYQKSLYSLSSEGARSMWFQLLIEVLVSMEHSDEAKSDLLEISRQQYKDDQAENKKIDEFDRTYTPEHVVWWYTTDSFLYRLLNKALRIENIDIIYKFRLFLTDLDNQIKRLYKEQSSLLQSKETFYRGQKIPQIELRNLQENIGSYVAMNTFTSVSQSREIALIYAGNGEDRPELESVIFQIEINERLSPCCNIRDFSQFSNEEELLLTIGSVFRIVDVKPSGDQWIIYLTLDKSDNQKMEGLKNFLRQDLFHETALINIAKILFRMSDYNRAEQYCIRAEKELSSDNNDRVGLYQLLGEIYQNGMGDYNKAKEMYDNALSFSDNVSQFVKIFGNMGLLQIQMGSYDMALTTLNQAERLSRKYNLSNSSAINTLANICTNIGITYRHKLNFIKSLQYYRHALDLKLQIVPELDPSLAALYSNIGNLSCITCDYEASLKAYENALKIQLQCLPEKHKDLATVYNNIALVYVTTERYSQALENFKKSLNMFEALLDADHPAIATLYHNIGDTYQRWKQYDIAVINLEKALQLRIQKLLPTHKHIAESYESLGWVYYYLSNYEKALDFCEKALKIEPNSPSVYNCMGIIFNLQCNYSGALSTLQKSIDLYEKFPAERTMALAKIRTTIGNILSIQKKFDDALKHYNKAIETYHSGKLSNSSDFIYIYSARGAFFSLTGEYDKALADLTMAFDMVKNSKVNYMLSEILIHMGNLHLKQNHFAEALSCIKDAEKNESSLSVQEHSIKGEILRLLAHVSHKQVQYDNALKYYRNALEIFSQAVPPNRLTIAYIHVELGCIYEQKCLYDESLNAFQEALHLFTMLFTSTHSAILYVNDKITHINAIRQRNDI